MLSLNLMSPQQRDTIRTRVLFSFIERVITSIIAGLLILGVVLFLISTRMTERLTELSGRQILSSGYITTNRDIKVFNGKLSRIQIIQDEIVPVSVLLTDVVERAPTGIDISLFDLSVSGESLKITGQAAVRDDVLDFESALIDSPYISELEAPISNLLRKTEVPFQFLAKPDLGALRSALTPEL